MITRIHNFIFEKLNILDETLLYDFIKSKTNTKDIIRINNIDFNIIFDININDKTLNLDWINNKSNKYSGKDIINALIKLCDFYNLNKIKAVGAKGKYHNTNSFGYYVLLKYGFIPKDGIQLINKVLNTNYKNFEEAYSDNNFLVLWKEKGIEYDGYLYLNKNSLSYKIFNNLK